MSDEQAASFMELKKALSTTPVLGFPDFLKPFKVWVDASGTGIGAFLSQDKHPIEFFIEKLSSSSQKWSTSEQEFYSLVRALKQWDHYLLGKEFILLIDHFSL